MEKKQLITLESPISTAQTNEMRSQNLQLVVPKSLHAPYKREQREWLMSVEEFVQMLRAKDALATA